MKKGIVEVMQRGTTGAGQTRASKIAAMLQGKRIFYVNIERPDNQGSTEETVIEDPEGITCTVEGDTITFRGNGKTASFVILENAQIIANQTEEADILVTFAENGGLQLKSVHLPLS